MSCEALRKVVGVAEPPIEGLFYGYSSVTGLARTSLVPHADISTALLQDGYGREDIDELIAYCDLQWRPTADVSAQNVALAQQGLVDLSEGNDTSLEVKVALSELREFAGDCIFEGQTHYPQEESAFILSLLENTGLSEELAEYEREEGGSLRDFAGEYIRHPAYGEEASQVIYDMPSKMLRAASMDNQEGRRRVAAAEFVTVMSLAVGALYAAHCEGKQFEGELADRLNPLLGV